MPISSTRPDESNTASAATTVALAKTGYAQITASTIDEDWFRLNLGPGQHQVSVLPDLFRLIFPTGSGTTVPANVPLITQETVGLSAEIVTRVIDNGVEIYNTIGHLTEKRDDLAMVGQKSLFNNDPKFLDGTFNFAGPSTVVDPFTGRITVYTGEYFVHVTAQSIGLLAHSGSLTDPLNYTPQAGRYLITTGNPTGQRTANWGSWIDTYKIGGVTGGTAYSPAGDQININTPPETILPFAAEITPNTATGYLPGQRKSYESPTYVQDALTGMWHAIDRATGLPVDLSFLGTGFQALKIGAADEFEKILWDAAKEAASGNVRLSYLIDVAKKIQSIGGLGAVIKSFHADLLDHINSSLINFNTLNIAGEDAFFNQRVDKFRTDISVYVKTGNATVDDGISKFFTSFGLLENRSDPSFAVDFDIRGQRAAIVAANGHNHAYAGSGRRDIYFGGNLTDVVLAGDGNDFMRGGDGSDALIGGRGMDRAGYLLQSDTASWTRQSNGSWVVSSADGTDRLRSVEVLDFKERQVALWKSTGQDLIGDFNKDGRDDMLWRNASGQMVEWQMTAAGKASLPIYALNYQYTARGVGDFNGDGKDDIVLRHENGAVYGWLMNGAAIAKPGFIFTNPGNAWDIVAVGDLNGDKKDDLLFANANGQLQEWLLNGLAVARNAPFGVLAPGETVQGTGDFNGDGRADLLLRQASGQIEARFTGAGGLTSGASVNVGGILPEAWSVRGIGDFNNDGKDDIVLRYVTGLVAVWIMNGASVVRAGAPGSPNNSWEIQGVGNFNGSGGDEILWRHDNGDTLIWTLNALGTAVSGTSHPGLASATDWFVL